ncbi:uncharacterized protein LOC134210721 [Armigeres subalbatus]|uniref:uncharacterized protein LOC134210721 n=1 Tax=Armigeres subalbatus TaxID=124917 RepID=UPI002ED566B1
MLPRQKLFQFRSHVRPCWKAYKSEVMAKTSAIGSLPMVHNLEQGKPHPLEFPLSNDVIILLPPTDTPNGRFDWKVLKTRRAVLRLGQIASSIVICALTVCYGLPETLLLFLAINALIGAVILLGDMVIRANPLRRAFTAVLWFKVELWYTGLVALAFHTMAMAVLVDGVHWYGIDSNHVAAAFGFVNVVLYLMDWWINFNKRHEMIQSLETKQANEVEKEAVPQ